MAVLQPELYQRLREEMRVYVQHAYELGFYGYCQPEHHLQIEGFEANNHPGMFSLFVGQHSKRMKAGIMGYTMTTHNPVRVAEEIATLDHMLQGRSEEHTSELQSLMRISYAVFCLKKKKTQGKTKTLITQIK